MKITYLETLRTVLDAIEGQDKLSVSSLSKAVFMSNSHLQRLFRQITGQSIMAYARGRRLAHSLNDLLSSDMRVIDIANKYGFEHEQSYIRIFRKEFGCTPGEARRRGHILPIRERILPEQLYDIDKGIMYGPEHVIAPGFHMVGKPALLKDFDDEKDALIPNMIGQKTYYEVLKCVKNPVCPDVYIGLSSYMNGRDVEYMPGLEVRNLSEIPDGMKGRTFPAQHCVRFRYVGRHRCEEISMVTAHETYAAIEEFFNKQDRYVQNRNYHFERIDRRLYDGIFCQMELLFPVEDKFNVCIMGLNPSP